MKFQTPLEFVKVFQTTFIVSKVKISILITCTHIPAAPTHKTKHLKTRLHFLRVWNFFAFFYWLRK
jgi:hypothetical protein